VFKDLFITGVTDTGHRFIARGVDTGDKFTTGVIDTCHKFITGVIDTGYKSHTVILPLVVDTGDKNQKQLVLASPIKNP